jgi:hypothetical protein
MQENAQELFFSKKRTIACNTRFLSVFAPLLFKGFVDRIT